MQITSLLLSSPCFTIALRFSSSTTISCISSSRRSFTGSNSEIWSAWTFWSDNGTRWDILGRSVETNAFILVSLFSLADLSGTHNPFRPCFSGPFNASQRDATIIMIEIREISMLYDRKQTHTSHAITRPIHAATVSYSSSRKSHHSTSVYSLQISSKTVTSRPPPPSQSSVHPDS